MTGSEVTSIKCSLISTGLVTTRYNSVVLHVINILRDWVTVSNMSHYNIHVLSPKPFKSHPGRGERGWEV